MKKTVLFTVIIVLIVAVVFLVNYLSPRFDYEEKYLESDNLLFCFSISRFGGGAATYYQVGKDGTLLRAEGYAESEYITDRGYFLTYGELIARNPNTILSPKDLGIMYDKVKISSEEVKELEVLLANCVSEVEEGTALLDGVFTQKLVHALFCDGKVYYDWADARGYTKDSLSLLGYKLEALSGIEESRYNGDSHYYGDVKSFLRNNEDFITKYGKAKNVFGARDWPVKRKNDATWIPFVVETHKYRIVLYIRFGGTNSNGECYIYEYQVEEFSKK